MNGQARMDKCYKTFLAKLNLPQFLQHYSMHGRIGNHEDHLNGTNNCISAEIGGLLFTHKFVYSTSDSISLQRSFLAPKCCGYLPTRFAQD